MMNLIADNAAIRAAIALNASGIRAVRGTNDFKILNGNKAAVNAQTDPDSRWQLNGCTPLILRFKRDQGAGTAASAETDRFRVNSISNQDRVSSVCVLCGMRDGQPRLGLGSGVRIAARLPDVQ